VGNVGKVEPYGTYGMVPTMVWPLSLEREDEDSFSSRTRKIEADLSKTHMDAKKSTKRMMT